MSFPNNSYLNPLADWHGMLFILHLFHSCLGFVISLYKIPPWQLWFRIGSNWIYAFSGPAWWAIEVRQSSAASCCIHTDSRRSHGRPPSVDNRGTWGWRRQGVPFPLHRRGPSCRVSFEPRDRLQHMSGCWMHSCNLLHRSLVSLVSQLPHEDSTHGYHLPRAFEPTSATNMSTPWPSAVLCGSILQPDLPQAC